MSAYIHFKVEISNDDKLILRNRIKQEDKEITNHFLKHKKDKNYQLLQINLRKTLQTIKGNNKLNLIQQLRGSSAGKRPQTPINMKKKNNITESSYPTSIQNSLHSSPTTQKPPVKAKINLNQINLQKHIENEIDR